MSLYQSITVDAEIKRSLIDVIVDLEKNTIYVDAEIINRIRSSDHEHFDGPYILIPKTEDQMLYTNNKIMDDDVIVTAIPYTEVSNLSGGLTVSIA